MITNRIRFLGSLAVCSGLVAGCGGGGSIAPATSGFASYTAVQIGSLPAGYKVVLVSGMNSSGTVTGAISNGGGLTTGVPFTWSESKGAKVLVMPGFRRYGFGASINDAGMVVGTGLGSPVRGLFWDAAGNGQDIGDLGGAYSQLFSINNSGVAVGTTSDASDNTHQISWSLATGIQDLNPVLGTGMFVAVIGDSGLIAGTVGTHGVNNFAEAAIYSPSSGVTPLGTFTGYGSIPQAVNSNGTVVGWANVADGPQVGFVWSATTGSQVLSTSLPAARGQTAATSVNSAGAVVGGGFAAYIWTAKDGLKLLSPITLGLHVGVTLTEAFAVNASGEIVAQGSDRNYYLLKPIIRSAERY